MEATKLDPCQAHNRAMEANGRAMFRSSIGEMNELAD